jgi:hypothetical protein
MRRLIVVPGAEGLISQAREIVGQEIPETAVVGVFEGKVLVGQFLPPGQVIIETDRTLLDPHEMVHLREDGSVESRFNYVGSGPWYDHDALAADRLTKVEITEIGIVPPNEFGHTVTPGWESMAMEPRAETPAEITAREEAAAMAAEAAELARIRSLEVDARQLGEAAALAGLISWDDATAWSARGELIPALAEAIDAAIPEADRARVRYRAAAGQRYRRDDPELELIFLELMSIEQLDQLFLLASTR